MIHVDGLSVLKAMKHDHDYVLCECGLEPLEELVTRLEQRHQVSIVKAPAVCLTMIRAEDSLEKQEFYLGEALTTECEVTVDDKPGFGVCLGEEPVRGYCLAVVDALLRNAPGGHPDIDEFLDRQGRIVEERETREFNLILRSQVDFKLMEQE
jgi:alpha-D-ribose 1-methylphosphonate 5-triphosphate synthase subunit PhnG